MVPKCLVGTELIICLDYPAPAGGYGSYGAYKRVIGAFVKRVFG